jgi:hypothetical protein
MEAVAADSDVVVVGVSAGVALACTVPQQFADKFAINRTDDVHVRGVLKKNDNDTTLLLGAVIQGVALRFTCAPYFLVLGCKEYRVVQLFNALVRECSCFARVCRHGEADKVGDG